MESVKLWRHLHASNKKISFGHAAKMIGISKKTLDDYFLVIRLGELYGFSFQNHLDERIGVLRAYIRKHENKELEGHMPKTIKAVEYVRDIQELIL